MAATQRMCKTKLSVPLQKCKHCFYQYTAMHPCLFCQSCLRKCTDVIDRSTNGLVRRNIHLVLQKQKRSERTSTALLPGRSSDQTHAAAPSKPASSTPGEERRWRILEQKAFELEKRATRCGFCLPTERRAPLVRYCGHCRKHMCAPCTERHRQHTLCKHHATVDLLAKNNGALM